MYKLNMVELSRWFLFMEKYSSNIADNDNNIAELGLLQYFGLDYYTQNITKHDTYKNFKN